MAVNKVQRKNGEIILDVTGVTASPSDVVPGKKYVNAEGVLVDGTMPSATQATPTISVSSDGLITASATQTAGRVAAGTKSATKQLTTQGAKTVTPTTSEQVAVAAGVYTTGDVKVAGVANDDLTVAVKVAQAALDAAYNNRSDVAAAKADYDRLTAELAGSAITIARANTIKTVGSKNITAAIAAFDISAASYTTVSGIVSISGNTKTLEITGLTFSKIFAVYFGSCGGALNNNTRISYLFFDGKNVSFTFSNQSKGYTYIQEDQNASYQKPTFNYSNGTLTITNLNTLYGSEIMYLVIGR